MSFKDTPGGVTTLLFVAFALFVIYTRMKNWLDSNVPVIFYAAMIVYANTLAERLPAWVVYAGFGLGMILRFEFMNTKFTKFIKVVEYCVLAAIVYLCTREVLLT
jgi:hypothetical protein